MALIPTTNVSMRDLQQEYGGSASNVSVDSYYRNLNNAALVDNTAIIPDNPRFYFDTFYTPTNSIVEAPRGSQSGGSFNYAVERVTTTDPTGIPIPGSPAYNYWRYGSTTYFAVTYGSLFSSGARGPYGSNTDYFYFVPNTNWPYAGQTRTINQMYIGINNVFTGNRLPSGLAIFTKTEWFSIWRTKGQAAYIADVNQNVPTSGQISLGQFRGMENP